MMGQTRTRKSWPATQPLTADNCILIQDEGGLRLGVGQVLSERGLIVFKIGLSAVPMLLVAALAIYGAESWVVVIFGFLAIIGALELTAENAFEVDTISKEVRITKLYLGFIDVGRRVGFDDSDCIKLSVQTTEHRRAARILASHGRHQILLLVITIESENDVAFAKKLVRQVSVATGWEVK